MIDTCSHALPHGITLACRTAGAPDQHPARLRQLAIVNAPHPGNSLRELNGNPDQQAASAYMNFLIRPDAEALLTEDDFRRLWEFFTAMGAEVAPGTPDAPDGAGWLTPAVKEQYRATWRAGLTGDCNYYRASPLRPPREGDPAAAAVILPDAMLQIAVPTLLVWAEDDTALAEGLEPWVPRLTVHRIPRATHWVVHEQPQRVIGLIADFLQTADATK